jgi:hypothetical protein
LTGPCAAGSRHGVAVRHLLKLRATANPFIVTQQALRACASRKLRMSGKT